MGIKGNFKTTVRKYFPDCFRFINGRDLSGKTVAIDFSNMYFRYKSIFREGEDWKKNIFSYIKKLLDNKIDVIVVFDGIAPDIKKNEQARRRDRQTHEAEKLDTLIRLRQKYVETGVVDEEITKMMDKKPKTPDPLVYRLIIEMPCDVGEIIDAQQPTTSADPLVYLDNMINRLKSSQVPKFDNVEVSQFKEDCKTKKIKIINAEGEAEQTCALLYKKGIVDCVLSQDSDLIALQCSFITGFKKSFGLDFEYFDFKILKERSKLDEKQIVDWCILCGTDYNNSIPRVGAVKALTYISKHKSIENLYKHATEMGDIAIAGPLSAIMADLELIRDQFNCVGIDNENINIIISNFSSNNV